MKQLLAILLLQLVLFASTAIACTNVETCLHLIDQPLQLELRLANPCGPRLEAPALTTEADGPKNWQLVLFGLGLAPVEFLVSTALHEGGHALAVEIAGGDVTSFRPYPHILDNGNFVFGSVSWTGAENVTPGEQAFILAAPMLIDTAVLAGYSSLSAFDLLPENKFARMAVIVFATGHWVDMLNHMISRNDFTDSARIRDYLETHHGMNEVESNLATRLPQGVVLLASGAFIARDLVQIFRDTNGGTRRPRTQLEESSLPGVYNLGVTPVVSSEFTGFSLSGSF